jgi:two-component system, OmpR family, sensor kinase
MAARRRHRRRPPADLRWRLTAWVAGVLLISAAIVFTVVYLSTGAQIRGQIDRDVAAHTGQLAQALEPVDAGGPGPVVARARAYLDAQPYSGTSTLLFVIVPGAAIVSNHPELFGYARAEVGESASEQTDENRTGRLLRSLPLGYVTARIADVGRVRVLERSLLSRGPRVVVGAGEPLVVVSRAQHSVARAFALAGAVTLLLALIASYLAGAKVSAPLRRMAAVARRVDAGELAPRMAPPAGSGTEIRVLAEAFNHMLDRLQEAFAGQRAFIADASHELRTPLTVIRGQLEVLAASEAPSAIEVRRVERLLQAEIARVSRLVDDLLLLAQADQREFLRLEPIDLRPFVAELWDGLSLTAQRRFELEEVPAGQLLADPDRLAQALRNLARNAIEHTTPDRGLVALQVRRGDGDQLLFTVFDDGPGIAPEERERVFERFHRTDRGRSRASGGAGLGLAIVRAIAQAHGGQVCVRGSRGGRGASLELRLPGFTAA